MSIQETYRERAHAHAHRVAFMGQLICYTQDQIVSLIETLGECKMEDDSREGRIVTQRCIDFAIAAGRFRYPNTFDDALRSHLIGG